MYKRTALRNASFRASISLQSFFDNGFESFLNPMRRTKTFDEIEEQSNETINFSNSYMNDCSENTNEFTKPNNLLQQNIQNLAKYSMEMDALYNEDKALRREIRNSKRQLIVIKFNNDRLKSKIAEAEEKLKEYEPLHNESLTALTLTETKKKEIRKSRSADVIKSSSKTGLVVFDNDASEDIGSKHLYTVSHDANKTKISIENVLRRLTGIGKKLTR